MQKRRKYLKNNIHSYFGDATVIIIIIIALMNKAEHIVGYEKYLYETYTESVILS